MVELCRTDCRSRQVRQVAAGVLMPPGPHQKCVLREQGRLAACSSRGALPWQLLRQRLLRCAERRRVGQKYPLCPLRPETAQCCKFSHRCATSEPTEQGLDNVSSHGAAATGRKDKRQQYRRIAARHLLRKNCVCTCTPIKVLEQGMFP